MRSDLFVQRGYTAIELLVTVAIMAGVAAMSVPVSVSMVRDFELSGDARGMSNTIAMAKMNAAAQFTRARVRVDLASSQFRVERWNRSTSQWVTDGAASVLGVSNRFGSGSITTPPPSSQAAVGQPPLCRDDAGSAVTGTACVIFNSRGVPVDHTGAPAANSVIYLSGPTAVYAIVVSSTSQMQVWRVSPGGGTWVQK